MATYSLAEEPLGKFVGIKHMQWSTILSSGKRDLLSFESVLGDFAGGPVATTLYF